METTLGRFIVGVIVATAFFASTGCIAPKHQSVNVEPSNNVPPATSVKPSPISIIEPTGNAEVGQPIIAHGLGIAFENTIQLRVLDANGNVIGEGYATAYAPEYDAPGPWRAAVPYRDSTTEGGWLEAYESSAMDGSELHLVRVPIRFAIDTLGISAYFIRAADGPPGIGNCPLGVVAERHLIPRTPAVARTAVEALLAGPLPSTNPEFTTAFWPPSVELRDISIVDGVARVYFSPELFSEFMGSGGDCRKQQAMAQLRATLTQFPTVRDVQLLENRKGIPRAP
ncbi:MAG: Gmad2 immunoglobulin-like domain-containing protein [Candidatus Uhrbacteria bacterium]